MEIMEILNLNKLEKASADMNISWAELLTRLELNIDVVHKISLEDMDLMISCLYQIERRGQCSSFLQ